MPITLESPDQHEVIALIAELDAYQNRFTSQVRLCRLSILHSKSLASTLSRKIIGALVFSLPQVGNVSRSNHN